MQTIRHFFKTFSFTTPVAIILAAIIISVSHITYAMILSKKGNTVALEVFKGRPIDTTDLITGKKNSDVVVVEYSDTECPFCAQLHPTMEKLKKEYGSKVAFVYRYFPLTQIHPDAFDEARAVFCVGKIAGAEKREEYINEMFTYKIGKQNMVLPKGGRESLAKNIGIDGTAFGSCMKSQEPGDAVNAGTQDGIAAGVEGTPATFVLVKNDDRYEVVSLVGGARPYEYFKAVMEEALSR
jgi:protein-disulfide isomerase